MANLLRQVAIGLLPLSLGGSWFCYRKMQDGLTSHSYFPQAMTLLRQNPIATDRLGKPIYNSSIHLMDQWNTVQATYAQLKIPVMGSRKKGVLVMWATRPDPGVQDWTVEKLHLLTEGEPTLFIHDPEKETGLYTEQFAELQ